MKSTKSDLPQGTLDLLILKVVALGPVHGYAIAQRLDQVSRGVVQVPQGSLYPALHRLENRGLLAADWKATETGREAKFYRLTRKGRARRCWLVGYRRGGRRRSIRWLRSDMSRRDPFLRNDSRFRQRISKDSKRGQ
jgi:transcriptional regulator